MRSRYLVEELEMHKLDRCVKEGRTTIPALALNQFRSTTSAHRDVPEYLYSSCHTSGEELTCAEGGSCFFDTR